MGADETARRTAIEDLEDRFREAQGSAEAVYGQVEAATRRGAAQQPLLALVLAGLTGYALALAVHTRR